jgi:thioredoxin reductase (NADPH)
MLENKVKDLVIIGGGPGGLTAGIYAMRAMLKTVLIEKGAPGGQMMITEEVENWPGDQKITGFELSQKFHEHAQSYDIEFINDEVTALEPGREFHTLQLADGTKLKSLCVILATGGSPRKLNIPGEMENYGKGVSYCGVCDGFFFRGKRVLIVGGGDTAAEEALYLAKLAEKVYMAHRRDELRAGKILQERIFAEPKIEMLWNTVPIEIKSDEKGVYAAQLKDTKTAKEEELAVDGVFIFIGFQPNNQLVPEGTKMNSNGYVMTSETCETNNRGIYVIGDLREKYARQIVTAAADGCTAALASAHCITARKAKQKISD